jgi:PEP-CTERM motif
MTRVPAVFLSLMFFVAFSCSATLAGADPIRVTSGVVEAGGFLDQPWNADVLDLAGTSFHILSSLEDEEAFVQLASRPTLAPGASINFSGVLRVADPVGAQVNNSFGVVSAPFTMSFDASPAGLTCSSGGSLTQCTATAPFTFNAELTITPLGGVPAIHHLIGRGTAEGTLSRLGPFEGGAVRYVFESSEVPEPATLSLFATGAIVAAARLWRRRRDGCTGA